MVLTESQANALRDVWPTAYEAMMTDTLTATAAAPILTEPYTLVIFRDNYADEFDMEGFAIMTEQEASEFLDAINHLEYPYEWGFGTNESCFWDEPGQLGRCFTTRPVEQGLARSIMSLLAIPYFDHTPFYFGDFPASISEDAQDALDNKAGDWLE